jgi:hypothetical protein
MLGASSLVGRCSGYREFGRLRVPAHVEVAGALDAYGRFDVTTIKYNVAG